MQKVIEYANTIIDKCARCTKPKECLWFTIVAGNVVFDDYTPEQYAEMTYEEIAEHIHDKAGTPTECTQQSFDGMMRHVEDLIETAVFPSSSEQLMNDLNKMARLEKRLKRLDRDHRDVFDAPIRAIVERSLAAIDYHFLKGGMDVSSLIQLIHSDYHRLKLLYQYYIAGAVDLLISKAKILSPDDIISYSGVMLSMAFPLAKTANQNNQIQETAPEEVSAIISKSWVEEFSGLINSQETFDFLSAVIAYMGYSPFTCHGYANEELREFMIAKGTKSKELYVYDGMPQVYEEIEAAVRNRKDNDYALKLYMADILSPFSQLASGLFGIAKTVDARATHAIIELCSPFRTYSLEEFKERWDKAVNDVKSKKNIEDNDFFDDVVKLMCDKYRDINYDGHGPNYYCIDAIDDLLFRLMDFESCIEAALLRNHIEHDYLYYEDFSQVKLGEQVSEHSVLKFTGLTPGAIQSLSKELKHRVRFDLKEGETLDTFIDRIIDGDEHQKYHLMIPEGISALEEVKLRFAGQDAKAPITAFLVKAGYETFVVCPHEDYDTMDHKVWADIHSEEWDRYLFDRWDDLREELSSAIKARVNDKLELKKYVCSLITPFDYYGYYDRFRFDWNTFAEPFDIIGYFVHSLHDSSDEFLKVWQEAVSELHAEDEIEHYSFDKYQERLCELFNEKDKGPHEQTDSREWEAFENREDFPSKYCGLIAGCLLENGAPLEYMDYQDMCGVELVEELESIDISSAMHWTEDLVFSYNPKRVVHSQFGSPFRKEKSSPIDGQDHSKKLTDYPELVQAITDKKIDKDGYLKVYRSEFVLYCHEKDYFAPRNRESGWRPIDGILKDKKGKPITAEQFRQSYQDLGRDGRVPID